MYVLFSVGFVCVGSAIAVVIVVALCLCVLIVSLGILYLRRYP